jgi:hypothetical protein
LPRALRFFAAPAESFSLSAWARVKVAQGNVTGVVLDPHPGWNIAGHLKVEGQAPGYFRYTISAGPCGRTVRSS